MSERSLMPFLSYIVSGEKTLIFAVVIGIPTQWCLNPLLKGGAYGSW